MASDANIAKFEKSFQDQLAHKNDSLSDDMVIEISVLLGLCWVAVILRLVSRRIQAVKLAANDYVLVASLLLTTITSAVTLRAIHFGFGRHLVMIGVENGFEAGKLLYVTESLFAATCSMTKISVLLLYQNVFSHQRAWFTWACRINITAWILLGIAGSALFTFQCWPIKLAWTSDHSSKCMDPQITLLATGIASIILNFFVLVLPIPLILGLQLNTKRKIGVLGLFILGSGDWGCSIVRVWQITHFNDDLPDATYQQGKSAFTTILDPTLAIICACLPLLRPVVRVCTNYWQYVICGCHLGRLHNKKYHSSPETSGFSASKGEKFQKVRPQVHIMQAPKNSQASTTGMDSFLSDDEEMQLHSPALSTVPLAPLATYNRPTLDQRNSNLPYNRPTLDQRNSNQAYYSPACPQCNPHAASWGKGLMTHREISNIVHAR